MSPLPETYPISSRVNSDESWEQGNSKFYSYSDPWNDNTSGCHQEGGIPKPQGTGFSKSPHVPLISESPFAGKLHGL